MVEVNFISGIEAGSAYPNYLKANRLKHRFAVLQNTHVEGEAEPFVDEALRQALTAFASAYDPTAEVVLSETAETLGPDFYSLADYDARSADDRPFPNLLALRKGRRFRLCMIAEAYDLSDFPQPFPYKDSCVYSIFTDRGIGSELVAFLHAHPEAAGWTLSTVVLTAAASEQYPVLLSRDDAVVPRRQRYPLWQALGLSVLALPMFVLCAINGLIKHDPIGFGGLFVAVYGVIALNFAWEMRDRKVILSWEGIRKGAGTRSKFIAWGDARLQFKESGVTVRSRGETVTVRKVHFNAKEFSNFFRVVSREITDQGLQRAALVPNLTSPPYTLSANDAKAFWKHKGVGRKKAFPPRIRPYTATALYMVPVMAFLIRYSPRRRTLPDILQSPPAYLAAAIAATLAVAGSAFLIERFFSARRAWKNLISSWRCLQDFTISISEAGVVDRTTGYEAFKPWDEIRHVVDTPKLVLFYTEPNAATVVPKRIFPSPADADAFCHCAQAFKRAFVEKG